MSETSRPQAAPSVWTRARRGISQGRTPVLWVLALLVGLIAGYAAIGLRLAIQTVQAISFGEFDERLASAAAELSALHIIAAPVIGGCVVGLLLYLGHRTGWLTDIRSEGVADVIEARAARSGQMKAAPGLLSALISAVSLGSGGSAGREGPAVHLGAMLAAQFTRIFSLPPRSARILLGCGAAAAVSASFNAPVAGALFAFEVVLGHYALRSIGPVAAASVTGAVLARFHFGPTPAFTLPQIDPATIADFAAMVPLGLFAAGLAIAFVMLAQWLPQRIARIADQLDIPLWALPPAGGLLVGMIAVAFPQVLGVGYEATSLALSGGYEPLLLAALVAAKLLATAITLAFRFGGGVFSPSLYLGAMLGALYGAGASALLGEAGSGATLFAVVGMGAVAGAVLGAPLSTTLIVFELTASYEASIALLVAVSLATVVMNAVTKGSFFHKQVARAGYDLSAGNARVILQTVRAREMMMPIDASERTASVDEPSVYEDDYLGRVLGLLSAEELDGAAVRARTGDQPVIGYITKADAHAAYARALHDAHEEEHG
ncbi:MAG: chloride channel protein [Pseudomonadota bacterium]